MRTEWVRGTASQQAENQRRIDEIDAQLQNLWALFLDALSHLAAGKVGLTLLPLALVNLAACACLGIFLEASLLWQRFKCWQFNRRIAADNRQMEVLAAGLSEETIEELLDRYYQQLDEEGK